MYFFSSSSRSQLFVDLLKYVFPPCESCLLLHPFTSMIATTTETVCNGSLRVLDTFVVAWMLKDLLVLTASLYLLLSFKCFMSRLAEALACVPCFVFHGNTA